MNIYAHKNLNMALWNRFDTFYVSLLETTIITLRQFKGIELIHNLLRQLALTFHIFVVKWHH